MTQHIDRQTGIKADRLETSGKALAVFNAGINNVFRNRNLLAVPGSYDAAQCDVTYPSSDDIREVTISATVAAATSNMYVMVMINATSDAAALAGLDATIDSPTIDIQWFKVRLGEDRTISFNSGVTRLSFLGVNCIPDIAIAGI